MTEQLLISTTEAMKMFGIATKNTMLRQIKNGNIPQELYMKFGRVYKFKKKKVEEFLS